jgi:hypothetical protein
VAPVLVDRTGPVRSRHSCTVIMVSGMQAAVSTASIQHRPRQPVSLTSRPPTRGRIALDHSFLIPMLIMTVAGVASVAAIGAIPY